MIFTKTPRAEVMSIALLSILKSMWITRCTARQTRMPVTTQISRTETSAPTTSEKISEKQCMRRSLNILQPAILFCSFFQIGQRTKMVKFNNYYRKKQMFSKMCSFQCKTEMCSFYKRQILTLSTSRQQFFFHFFRQNKMMCDPNQTVSLHTSYCAFRYNPLASRTKSPRRGCGMWMLLNSTFLSDLALSMRHLPS